MTINKAAADFAARWEGRGDEKQDTQKFWIDLLGSVLGVDDAVAQIEFEKPAEGVGYIDAYLPGTRVLVEQKSLGVRLDRAYRQSDGAPLTPYLQARRYADALPLSVKPRWIVACDFASFEVHDMERPSAAPETVMLSALGREAHRLLFLADPAHDRVSAEVEVSVEAGRRVGRLYDALRAQYRDPDAPETLASLNRLCVRLVFCLYAEDAGVFPRKQMFGDYLRLHSQDARRALLDVFAALDTPPAERDPYMEPALMAFPHVGGDLFRGPVVVPRLTAEIVRALVVDSSEEFDWSRVSPTVFGALFESTLNPAARRSGGMHYTSVGNIHRLIGPLFLDGLHARLDAALAEPDARRRARALCALREGLASLRFLDPACGSGNFLTETFLCLRRLEQEVVKALNADGVPTLPLPRVSARQVAGIEVNDFAAAVARAALWIAESQTLAELDAITGAETDFLPLPAGGEIVCADALRTDWREVCGGAPPDYIIGNPPFVGARMMSREQKDDLLAVFGRKWQGVGDLDYVSCWFKKAADMMSGSPATRTALVSTNSIVQGGSVFNLWKPLMAAGVKIDFAWRSFVWDSEAVQKAHVHVVIVGFSCCGVSSRLIYSELSPPPHVRAAANINAYLLDAPDVFIEKRTRPLCDVPEMLMGGQPIDDGNLTLTREQKDELVAAEPQAARFIRPYMTGKDFIDRRPRYCLWLNGAEPSALRKSKIVMRRVAAVWEFRLRSNRTGTLRTAETPALFGAPFECESDYLALPRVSSERRSYVPIDNLGRDIIPGDTLFVTPNATLYHFGVLTSSTHMAWMRAVCGRLKSDYRYSKDVVYNNFPWPAASAEAIVKIEKSAQAILAARAAHPGASLADLYDDLLMPPDLRSAHRANDRAVLAAYGWPADLPEEEIVARLMALYSQLIINN